MSKLKPISHSQLIKRLKEFGFEGLKAGGKHLYVRKNQLKVTIPNPHKKKDISVGLLAEILKKAGISQEDWIK